MRYQLPKSVYPFVVWKRIFSQLKISTKASISKSTISNPNFRVLFVRLELHIRTMLDAKFDTDAQKKKYDEVVFHCGFFAIGICLPGKLSVIFFISHTKTQVLSLERFESSNLGNIRCLLYTWTLIVGARTREFLFVDNKSLRSTTSLGFSNIPSLSRLRRGIRRSSLSRRLSYLVVMPSRCSTVPLHQLSCTLGVVLERWLTSLVPHLGRSPSRSLFDARLCPFAEVDIKWRPRRRWLNFRFN